MAETECTKFGMFGRVPSQTQNISSQRFFNLCQEILTVCHDLPAIFCITFLDQVLKIFLEVFDQGECLDLCYLSIYTK